MLTEPAETPAVPVEVRERAAQLLESYPDILDTQFVEPQCQDSVNASGETKNHTGASDKEEPSSGTWWSRLLEDPQRMRLKVANIGIVIGIVLALLVAWTSFSLRP
mgnify:CR=1 FL=1